jgi:hypothetical protein
MTDSIVCARFTFGAPMTSVEALIELRSLLDSRSLATERKQPLQDVTGKDR